MIEQTGNRNPTAQVWLFAYGGIAAGTLISLLGEDRTWGPNLDIQVEREDALIPRSRSKVASRFMRTARQVAGDVLLMVDHDIAWAPGDLALLARRALEYTAVVAGIYSKRTWGKGPALQVSDEAQGDFQMGEDDVIPCNYVGTGFIAIPRSILEDLADTLPTVEDDEQYQPFFLDMLHEQQGKLRFLSEDWAFCQRVRDRGYRVLASTAPTLVHEGAYGYRVQDSTTAAPPLEPKMTLHFGTREAIHA